MDLIQILATSLLQTFGPATLLKRYFNAGVFLWILRNSQGHFFSQNTSTSDTPLLKSESSSSAETETFEIIETLINFKLEMSDWHWKANHWSNINIKKQKGLAS